MLTIAPSPATIPLRAGALEATVLPGTGMAVASLRHHGEELLAQPGTTLGIPFLHPWANRLDGWRHDAPDVPRDEHGLQIHGVRPRAWSVGSAQADAVTATLCFTSPAFPFAHTVHQEVRVAPGALRITTSVIANGGVGVPIAFGFHPYLVLPGVPRAEWELTLPARRHLLTDARGIPTGATTRERAERAPLGHRTFDDGYDGLGRAPRFAIAGGGRRLDVAFVQGYPVAQVFAPATLDAVCFEPMTAPVNALVSGGAPILAPGRTFAAAFEIRVSG
jgi:galactose mutarotase-like enzyme